MGTLSKVARKLVLPLTRLHVPFVSATLANQVERHLSDRTVRCNIRGIDWELDLNELIDHRIYYLGTHERFTTKRILEAVPPGGVFFDVGANFGYFSLLVAQQLGGRGKVYAFEPMKRAMDKLRSHAERNGLSNIVTEKIVLTDVPDGPVEIAFQNSWRMWDRDEQGTQVETIPTTTLDEYVAAHHVHRIDVMKVDVDGYELKVMTGARRVLEEMKPIILIELGSYTLERVGDSLPELMTLLESAGYAFYDEVTGRRFGNRAEVMAKVPAAGTLNVVCKAA